MNMALTGAAVGYAESGLSAKVQAAPVPRTIASAISRVDSVNERLNKVSQHIATIAEQIGGPYPVGTDSKAAEISSGAVGRLNDAADRAHDVLAEIEDRLSGISRSLG